MKVYSLALVLRSQTDKFCCVHSVHVVTRSYYQAQDSKAVSDTEENLRLFKQSNGQYTGWQIKQAKVSKMAGKELWLITSWVIHKLQNIHEENAVTLFLGNKMILHKRLGEHSLNT